MVSLDKSFEEFYYKREQRNEVMAEKKCGVKSKFLRMGWDILQNTDEDNLIRREK